jgi:hypothetical protein
LSIRRYGKKIQFLGRIFFLYIGVKVIGVKEIGVKRVGLRE